MEYDLPYQLIVWSTPNVKYAVRKKALHYYGSAKLLLESPSTALCKIGFSKENLLYFKNPNKNFIEKHLEWLTKENHTFLTPLADTYPFLLKQISQPPILLVEGDSALLSRPQIAIVGSRNPTCMGFKTAYQLGMTLVKRGWIPTSGLAMGIDGAAHTGALSAGGKTVAVLGSGPDIIYPASHEDLAYEIIKTGGVIVSEYWLGTGPRPKHFPRRNRIISGLSLGVVVVEATLRSGSLITARRALEQNREVFAVPGPIQSLLSQGCHHLIQEGAKLVTTVEDILEEFSYFAILPPDLEKPKKITATQLTNPASPNPPLAPSQLKLLECIGSHPCSIDDLTVCMNLLPHQTMSLLAELEIEGYIKAIAGGYIRAHP